jgi:RNA polymerase sigma factor (sigma-70 family)
MSDAKDRRLLASYCRKGNGKALDELCTRWFPRLCVYLRRLVGAIRNEAEDLAQAVLVKVAMNAHRFTHGSFRAWIYRIAHNLAIDTLRKREREPLQSLLLPVELTPAPGDPLVDATPSPEAAAISNETIAAILEAIDQLPGDQKQAMLLRVNGLRPAEIAEVLGWDDEKGVQRVNYTLHQARKQLHRCLTRAGVIGIDSRSATIQGPPQSSIGLHQQASTEETTS